MDLAWRIKGWSCRPSGASSRPCMHISLPPSHTTLAAPAVQAQMCSHLKPQQAVSVSGPTAPEPAGGTPSEKKQGLRSPWAYPIASKAPTRTLHQPDSGEEWQAGISEQAERGDRQAADQQQQQGQEQPPNSLPSQGNRDMLHAAQSASRRSIWNAPSSKSWGRQAQQQASYQSQNQFDKLQQHGTEQEQASQQQQQNQRPANGQLPGSTKQPRISQLRGVGKERWSAAEQSTPAQRELCGRVTTAATVEELLALLTDHAQTFNHICLSACFLRLTKLSQQLSRSSGGASSSSSLNARDRVGSDPSVSPWVPPVTSLHKQAATRHIMASRPQSSRQNSNSNNQNQQSVTGAGSGVRGDLSPAQQVLTALQLLLEQWLPQMDMRCLANVLWACAKLQSHAQLCPWLHEAADMVTEQLLLRGVQRANSTEEQIRTDEASTTLEMSCPKTVSNLIYSLVLLGVTSPDQHRALDWLGQGFMPLAEKANAQDLCNVAYALALHGSAPAPLWSHVCATAAKQLTSRRTADLFVGQGLANLAWAVGKLGAGSTTIILALKDHLALTPIAQQMASPQEAANIVWAAACLGITDKNGWYRERAALLVPSIQNMNMQLLSMSLWAYATAEVRACPGLVDAALGALTHRPAWHLGRQPMALCNILWSLAKLDRCDTQLFLLLQPVALAHMDSFSHVEQQMLLWALGKFVDSFSSTEMLRYLELLDQQLVCGLLERIAPRIHSMSAHEVGTLAATLTLLTWYDERVNTALTRRASLLVDSLTLPQVSTLLWWLAKIVMVDPHVAPCDAHGPHAELRDRLLVRLGDVGALAQQEVPDQFRETARCLWCCAILAPGNIDIMRRLMGVLAKASQTPDVVQSCMVAQALHAMCQLGRVPDRALGWLQEEPVRTLVSRAVSMYQGVTGEAAPSATQVQVHAELEHVRGVQARQLEVSAAEGMFRIDILVRYMGVDIGMEVDGPFHYMMNRQGIVSGDTLFRNRLLASHGYQLLTLRASEFTQLGTIQRRTKLLGELLHLAVTAPEQLAVRERQVGDGLRPVVLHLPRTANSQQAADGAPALRPTYKTVASDFTHVYTPSGPTVQRGRAGMQGKGRVVNSGSGAHEGKIRQPGFQLTGNGGGIQQGKGRGGRNAESAGDDTVRGDRLGGRGGRQDGRLADAGMVGSRPGHSGPSRDRQRQASGGQDPGMQETVDADGRAQGNSRTDGQEPGGLRGDGVPVGEQAFGRQRMSGADQHAVQQALSAAEFARSPAWLDKKHRDQRSRAWERHQKAGRQRGSEAKQDTGTGSLDGAEMGGPGREEANSN